MDLQKSECQGIKTFCILISYQLHITKTLNSKKEKITKKEKRWGGGSSELSQCHYWLFFFFNKMSAQPEMGVSIYWEPPEAQTNISGTFKYTVFFEGGSKTKEGLILSMVLVSESTRDCIHIWYSVIHLIQAATNFWMIILLTFPMHSPPATWQHLPYCLKVKVKSLNRGLQPTRLLHPWNFLGKSTGVVYICLNHGWISALRTAPHTWQVQNE